MPAHPPNVVGLLLLFFFRLLHLFTQSASRVPYADEKRAGIIGPTVPCWHGRAWRVERCGKVKKQCHVALASGRRATVMMGFMLLESGTLQRGMLRRGMRAVGESCQDVPAFWTNTVKVLLRLSVIASTLHSDSRFTSMSTGKLVCSPGLCAARRKTRHDYKPSVEKKRMGTIARVKYAWIGWHEIICP
ncbi:hypothetical protein LZ31DRAFT_99213 [Colletotrichum somersetense]|nr:hypothetical protein LZ31DRAFT_99213 [Colletotrichum somersetense]